MLSATSSMVRPVLVGRLADVIHNFKTKRWKFHYMLHATAYLQAVSVQESNIFQLSMNQTFLNYLTWSMSYLIMGVMSYLIT